MGRRTPIIAGAIAVLVLVPVLAVAIFRTDRSNSPERASPAGSTVVLYCATDREIAQDLIDQFEEETGIHVE
jgi:iron(III) transport system substrate-binding protein